MIRVTLYGRRRRLRSHCLRTFEDDPDIPSCPRPDTAGSWMPRGWKYAVGTVDKRGFASMAPFRAMSQAAQNTLTYSSGSLAQLPEKTSAAPTEGSLPLAVLRWGAHWILSLGRNVGR